MPTNERRREIREARQPLNQQALSLQKEREILRRWTRRKVVGVERAICRLIY